MTRIPRDPEGYSVSNGVVHTRYATHSKGNRVRTVDGALALLDNQKATICRECYPVQQSEKPKAGPQQRRTQHNSDAP